MRFIPDIHQPKQKEEQELELLLGKRYEQFRFKADGYGKEISKPSGSGLNIPEEGLAASRTQTNLCQGNSTIYGILYREGSLPSVGY